MTKVVKTFLSYYVFFQESFEVIEHELSYSSI